MTASLGAVVWGGVISGALYVGAAIAVLLALPARDIGAVQGIIEAVTHMSNAISNGWSTKYPSSNRALQ